MDAQNAIESASTKPVAPASPRRPATTTDPEQSNNTSSSSVNKPRAHARSSPPAKDVKANVPISNTQDEDGGADNNSEAETIVLAGKDGSPVKMRKLIKHEDNSDGEERAKVAAATKLKQSEGPKEDDKVEKGSGGGSLATAGATGAAAALSIKKKRLQEKPRSKDGKDGSSGLSSAPASPPHRPRHRSTDAHRLESESESIRARSPKPTTRDKDPKDKHDSRPSEKPAPQKRRAPKADSDDEAENRRVRRQRTSASIDATSSSSFRPQPRDRDLPRLSSSKSHHEIHSLARQRSISPHSRTHRRSISTQLTSQSSNGLSHKKKRVPAPLTTEYHSDESSASGSPHIRSSKLRSLTTPATAESTISPAKMAPHKKHVDAHGQTQLAKACSRGEYDNVKQKLTERPDDLNFPDYAGNTPLQIASINGYEDIVKLLVDAGCNLDCVNYDKDTPLLDAVDNGHLEVVKVLLEAGVNPRKANVNGEEPLDRVNDDLDNAEEIRVALTEAKQKMGERRRTSEEHHEQLDSHSSHGADSPRRSPATGVSSHAGAGSRRAGTVRSTKTSNHLLYMPMDDKTLRQAAGKGDEETVTRILQVRDSFDDPESMVAAARGGHDIVMQLLLALGSAKPDPPPVSSMPPEYATPILAAIGQDNLKVVQLLLDQQSFDPTRRFKGETYHEIARKRQGSNWKEEEHILKKAYDEYKKSHKDSSKKSPNRRDQERDTRRAGRSELKDESSRSHKRKASSPTRDSKRAVSTKAPGSPKEKKRANSFGSYHDDQTSPKRGPGRPRKDDRGLPTIAISDRENSPSTTKPQSKSKRADDVAALSSDGELHKPRRKLVSGRDLKGKGEKIRRASMVSNASSLREPSSPRDSRHDDAPKSEKYHDRTKALKRDESRDRLSVSGEGSGKRHRASATPDHVLSEKEGEAPTKRRRLDVDGKERRPKPSSSPDDRQRKSGASRDAPATTGSGDKTGRKHRGGSERRDSSKPRKADTTSDSSRRESGKLAMSEKSIHVKAEDPDVEMHDVDQGEDDEAEARALQDKKNEAKRQAELEAKALETKKKEADEQKRREEKEKRDLEAKRRDEAEKKRIEEELNKSKEEERRRLEEDARKKREEKERLQREEADRRRREAEEQKKLHEEEERKKRLEEEERRKREEEEERKRREEEERLRKEELERKAAEEARRKREEEEQRKEQERREHQIREEKRAAREAEQRRIREEQEILRLSKLPPLLRWLDQSTDAKSPEMAAKFSIMQGVRYDCIRPEATGTPDGREQWVLNTQAALVLGENDLELTRYTSWERLPVSLIAKRIIWRLESDRYALTTPSLYDVGRQLPDYYCGEDPDDMSYKIIEKLRGEAWQKFAAMDMFFVKVN